MGICICTKYERENGVVVKIKKDGYTSLVEDELIVMDESVDSMEIKKETKVFAPNLKEIKEFLSILNNGKLNAPALCKIGKQFLYEGAVLNAKS